MLEPPVSRQAISKRVSALEAAGRITTRRGPRGTKLVNVPHLKRVIGAETDPAQELRNRREVRATAPAEETDPPEPVEGQASFHQSKALHASFQAENARLDLLERRGELTKVDAVNANTMDVMRRLRDRLLGLPGVLAGDDLDLRGRLDKEIRQTLEQFADELDELARDAGGDGPAGGE